MLRQSGRGLLLFAAILTVACVPAREAGPIEAALATDAAGAATVRISGLSSRELAALRGLVDDAWPAVVSISVEGAAAPMAGAYAADSTGITFTPAFPFDPGRPYVVRVDPARLPVPRAGAEISTTTVALPVRESPRVRVVSITPSATTWPENTLRFYLHFSGPMSREPTAGRVKLLDQAGREVTGALLESDVDLWNEARTRVTVFFDPGRVKRGIRPNLEMGRALREGQRYAIAVDSAWRDAAGRPLEVGFHHVFRAGQAIERELDLAAWRITPPPAGARDTLVVTFPWALDHGLLRRVLSVASADGRVVDGTVDVDREETRWRFTPEAPWTSGAYVLVAEAILEDPSGNRIGRAFEITAPPSGGRGLQGLQSGGRVFRVEGRVFRPGHPTASPVPSL